ncbi:probable RNA helicase SDE3 [Humulus lupulus]|uniref:probable RNA helicase SDE3 n=1 Tax=Humulus lupulus TaxID=3486 RepID=UPI002B4012F8|nr:probable RNA helicase SDE3 [Humulus lupulus]
MDFWCNALSCFLCCQDEIDDTFYIDCNVVSTIKNTFKRGSQSDHNGSVRTGGSPSYNYQVIHDSDYPNSVPGNSNHNRSSYAQNQAHKDLERRLLQAPINRSLLSSSSSSTTTIVSSANRTSNSSSALPQSSSKNSSSNPSKPATSSSKVPSSSESNSSPKKPPPTFKPFLSPASPSVSTNQLGKANYVLEENDSVPLYIIPEDIKDLIKKGIVPEVLKKILSPSRYKDYFSALLYAEDYYYKNWNGYELLDITLELREATVSKNINTNEKKEIEDKQFVAFKMDVIPERRPFLLSRDLVFARPSGTKLEPFQGIIYRVKNRNTVLVEFNNNFHRQHHPSRRYDISFSFNRVSLKRAHQALNSISDFLLENFLFPNSPTRKTTTTPPRLSPNLDQQTATAVRRILAVQSSPPYLISGPRCASEMKAASHLREPSRTGAIIRESVIQIYKTSPNCRILICAPTNSACDVLMRSLNKSIPVSAMFRANAAFRERENVPEDILSSCLIEEECFGCPPIAKLREFKVIFSTFMSSFRLHKEGLSVKHFSHIFMVDASYGIEPEALVVLANFAGENTAVVVAGEVGGSPNWVRSDIGRRHGLKVSYFERLSKFRPYLGLNPEFTTHLDMNKDAVYM